MKDDWIMLVFQNEDKHKIFAIIGQQLPEINNWKYQLVLVRLVMRISTWVMLQHDILIFR